MNKCFLLLLLGLIFHHQVIHASREDPDFKTGYERKTRSEEGSSGEDPLFKSANAGMQSREVDSSMEKGNYLWDSEEAKPPSDTNISQDSWMKFLKMAKPLVKELSLNLSDISNTKEENEFEQRKSNSGKEKAFRSHDKSDESPSAPVFKPKSREKGFRFLPIIKPLILGLGAKLAVLGIGSKLFGGKKKHNHGHGHQHSHGHSHSHAHGHAHASSHSHSHASSHGHGYGHRTHQRTNYNSDLIKQRDFILDRFVKPRGYRSFGEPPNNGPNSYSNVPKNSPNEYQYNLLQERGKKNTNEDINASYNVPSRSPNDKPETSISIEDSSQYNIVKDRENKNRNEDINAGYSVPSRSPNDKSHKSISIEDSSQYNIVKDRENKNSNKDINAGYSVPSILPNDKPETSILIDDSRYNKGIQSDACKKLEDYPVSKAITEAIHSVLNSIRNSKPPLCSSEKDLLLRLEGMVRGFLDPESPTNDSSELNEGKPYRALKKDPELTSLKKYRTMKFASPFSSSETDEEEEDGDSGFDPESSFTSGSSEETTTYRRMRVFK